MFKASLLAPLPVLFGSVLLVYVCDEAALARGGGGGHGSGHGGGYGGGHAVYSGGGGGEHGGGYSGYEHGYGYGRGYGYGYGGGYGYGDYGNYGYGYGGNMTPPPSTYQSQVFSGPAYIGPNGYSNYVQTYSYPESESAISQVPNQAPSEELSATARRLDEPKPPSLSTPSTAKSHTRHRTRR